MISKHGVHPALEALKTRLGYHGVARNALPCILLLAAFNSALGQTNAPGGALVVPAPSTNGASTVEATLRDIKPPVHIPDYWLWFWTVVGLIGAAVVSWLIWKFWLKKRFEPAPIPPVPPHVRARRKLNEASLYINDVERFTVFVSGTIRVYLEENFDLRAPERTTEEFLYELQSSRSLAQNVKESLGDFLSRCDLVKFAKYQPNQLELEDLLKSAYRIVEETEPRVNVQPALSTGEKKP